MKPCDKNIQKTIELAGEMMRLADQADREREDPGCGILYGILRDSAYKIQKTAEKEKQSHIQKGWWLDESDLYINPIRSLAFDQTKTGEIRETPITAPDNRVHINPPLPPSNIKGSHTEKNLLKAYAGETQTCNRYIYYASQAEKEGFFQIASIFLDTANQEKEHARLFLTYLSGGELEITCTFSAAGIGTTIENLKVSVENEKNEHNNLYPKYAAVAENEGFTETADLFFAIANAEEQHSKRFLALAENIEANRVFCKTEDVFWSCINCGYTQKGACAPNKCPACNNSRAYYEVLGNNW